MRAVRLKSKEAQSCRSRSTPESSSNMAAREGLPSVADIVRRGNAEAQARRAAAAAAAAAVGGVQNAAASANVYVQVYDAPSYSTLCDVVLTFVYTSGNDANGWPQPLLSGPFTASLIDSTTGEAWAALLDALKAAKAVRAFPGLGAPAQALPPLTFTADSVTIAGIPAPPATTGTATNVCTVQYAFVQLLGVRKAAVTEYFPDVAPGATDDLPTLSLAFSPSASVSTLTTNAQVFGGQTQGGVMSLSNLGLYASTPCPTWAPFSRGVCDLREYSPCGRTPAWMTALTYVFVLCAILATASLFANQLSANEK